MPEFFRFPQTPHLAWLGPGTPRDDKLLSPVEVTRLLAGEVVVEEKLDGANLGFSLARDGSLRVQNRGQYLHQPHVGQFARLPDWLALHGSVLQNALTQHTDRGLMLFGEWCAARHSLDYTALPDWFLLFDVYERRSGRFWSSARRNALATGLGLATVPQVTQGHCTLAGLITILDTQSSRYRPGVLEGLVVRRDDVRWCQERAKLVRADFTQAIEGHWRQRAMEWNRMDWGAQQR
ncbi:RNA ligase family protein [Ottowia sp.]|uniref:RNA ligase family protein n=1 Tax=Ottowia sp. TaxID=1898956 RepID=UPI0025EB2D23|nr:RNA ligase family protein [Ottowia sp.]